MEQIRTAEGWPEGQSPWMDFAIGLPDGGVKIITKISTNPCRKQKENPMTFYRSWGNHQLLESTHIIITTWINQMIKNRCFIHALDTATGNIKFNNMVGFECATFSCASTIDTQGNLVALNHQIDVVVQQLSSIAFGIQ